jgi:hypothetical protein
LARPAKFQFRDQPAYRQGAQAEIYDNSLSLADEVME